MKNATLVVMAAGIGSRFGGGIKQLEPVGPNGELIIDYAIYDAINAGFNKVVFVIRKSLEKDFKERIGNRIEKVVKVEYVYQEIDDIPAPYQSVFVERTKPWGTGQAILCCKSVVNEPFLVINADDYYGKNAFVVGYQYLVSEKKESDKLQIGMISYVLENTLSDNGGVTRGLCQVDDDHMLVNIVETRNIIKTENGAAVFKENGEVFIDVKTPVSMNMWGFSTQIFEVLENGFEQFLCGLVSNDYTKEEYLLPSIVEGLVCAKDADVKVIDSNEKWFGITYKEDKEAVVSSIRGLADAGVYPKKLF